MPKLPPEETGTKRKRGQKRGTVTINSFFAVAVWVIYWRHATRITIFRCV